MESRKERVLAYSMAKVIGDDELAAVSGGGAGPGHMSHIMTLAGSAGSGQPTMAHLDAKWDW